MHRHLGLALSFSALLIGGATWFRFASAENFSPTLSVVNDAPTSISEVSIVDSPITSGNSASANLTTTDLVGRQLVSDYLSLASNGQATDENINSLVGNFATNLSNLNSFKLYSSIDLVIVPDSKTSLEAYGASVSRIYKKYHDAAGRVVATAGPLTEVESKNFSSAMVALADLYKKSSEELKTVPTPSSLAEAHLKLVNNYISSSNALTAVANVNKDSTTAYAALSTQTENSAEETLIFSTIQTKLLGNGIIFNISS